MKRKVLIFFLVIVVLLSSDVNGFYSFEKSFSLFQLKRNIIPANYTVSYDKDSFTNENVELKIEFDKVISILGDNQNAILSEDGKKITKIIEANENSKFLIRDEDFNYQEVEYNVNWIDKNPPVISGAENGKIYNEDVNLTFSDETEIKEIYADYYNNSFSVYKDKGVFLENENFQIIATNRNSITIYVTENKKEMEKYNYYMDGVLYATTHSKSYTFTGLELSDTKHRFVVEALDRYGNVLESKSCTRNTIPMDNIRFWESGGIKYIAIEGIPETTNNVKALTWVDGHYEETLKENNEVQFENPTTIIIPIDIKEYNNYTGAYRIDCKVNYTGENGQAKSFNYTGKVTLPTCYQERYIGLPNTFTDNGNYYVRCVDSAGNEKELEFVIKK